MIQKLSVFFPAFNEEANIEKTVRDALSTLKKLKLEDFELIVINDGSKDSTVEIVSRLVDEDKRIRLVNHEKNKGYGQALKTGFKEAKYEWVAFADSDGQFDFGEITKLLDKTDQSDFILGYRLKRMDSFVRIAGTYFWNLLAKFLLSLPARDYSCGFKLIKKSSFEKVLPLEAGEKVTQIEMLVKAKRAGALFSEVGVHHYPRKFGVQTGANFSVVIKSYLDLTKLWWKLLNKKQFLIISGILALAALLRFYKLSEYMTFLGDEGRDALMIKRILTTLDIPLLGPPTSIGNMYLGPLYYYMMAIPMTFFWLNPVAAAGMVASLGVATVWLIYYLAKEKFGFLAGITAAFLYSISPITIIYSRSSWNPNPAPFFALLCFVGLFKLNQTGNFLWMVLIGASLAFAVQMHYLALILVPVVWILWAHEVFYRRSKKQNIENLKKGTLWAAIIFLFLMSPLLVFDLKHDFMNYKSVSTFFTNRETTVNLNPLNTLMRVVPIYNHNLVGRYLTQDLPFLTPLVSILIIVPLALALWKRIKLGQVDWLYWALGIWLIVAVLGLALYKQTIYDHYLGFLNPVPFLLLGSLVGIIVCLKGRLKMIIGWGYGILILALVVVNLQNSPLNHSPNNQLKRTQDIAKFVIGEAGGKPFNFALIAKNNYDAAYQFYLDFYGYKPKQVPFEITDQLFVVCEDYVCLPVGHPKQEISHFGMSKIENQTEFSGVKVFKLIANPSGKPAKI